MTTETEKKLTINQINKTVMVLRTKTQFVKCEYTGDLFLSQTFSDENKVVKAICISCGKFGCFW